MIRLAVPTTRITPEVARELRWQHLVTEVGEYKQQDRTVLLVWETASPEVAITQLTRLAGHMIGAYQLLSEADEQAQVRGLELAHAGI